MSGAKEWSGTTIQYAAQSKEWMRAYLFDNPYCRWGPDVIVWPVSGHNWSVATRPMTSSPLFKWNISIEETLTVLEHLPLGTRTSVVIHPIYFSQDTKNA